ncbi:MAG TPA: succinate dehydrogenase cytochrome b subunit [Acidimicrobiales bacterium]|nr:succinate dehydrogenase cytochrome b subunit [Acidimicrobiales bacterium]
MSGFTKSPMGGIANSYDQFPPFNTVTANFRIVVATQQDLTTAPTPVVNGEVRRRRWWPLEFYRSAVGKKWVMAITGIVWLGYVAAHLFGNLKAYLGPAEMNSYAEGLRDLFTPVFPRSFVLWVLRSGLIAALVIHIHAAYTLTVMNHRARPEKYESPRDYAAANYASRTMRWSGIIVLLFIAWHLADLTAGSLDPHFVRGDPYNNLVHSFERPAVAILYIVAMLALGLHLFHGAWSMFQSLGANNPRFNKWRRYFASTFAAVIVVGNLSFPILVQAKVLSYDQHARDDVVALHQAGK